MTVICLGSSDGMHLRPCKRFEHARCLFVPDDRLLFCLTTPLLAAAAQYPGYVRARRLLRQIGQLQQRVECRVATADHEHAFAGTAPGAGCIDDALARMCSTLPSGAWRSRS